VAVRTLQGNDNKNNNNIKYHNIESEGDEHYSCGVGGNDGGGGGVVIYYIYRLSDWCQQLVAVAAAVEAVAVEERVLCV